MKPKIIEEIFSHAKEEFPRECCGLIIQNNKNLRYIRCKNVAESPDEDFEIDPHEYVLAESFGEIIRVVHSHCGDNVTTKPSAADIACCNESGIPWIIVSLPEGDYREIMPEKPALLGRSFALGSYDCWGLIMEWHKQQGIQLHDWRVPYHWWESGDEDRYLDNWFNEGFREVLEPSAGCMIIMQVSAPVANHAGILLPDNMLLHHLYGQLSTITPYGGYWRERTVKTVRHKDLGCLKPFY
ncbi:C40 family peptidase [Enterobacter huaxiensis]|uniref:C40 family peptidase n=1 Tax=Enterobacter huaxiensis TaxID=2494702 RepID=UPI002175B839|nr:C40 family peptidase [Enterobacter huaxiensis]MCS5452491.1 C40 family peptidase [Enterobacter huaxiensis]